MLADRLGPKDRLRVLEALAGQPDLSLLLHQQDPPRRQDRQDRSHPGFPPGRQDPPRPPRPAILSRRVHQLLRVLRAGR